jgi:hypothetical protein
MNDRCSLQAKKRTNMKRCAIIILTAIAFAGSSIAAESVKRKPDTATSKPLTYANVVSLFKEAHLRPTEVQKRCTIFFEGEWKNANIYSYCVIMVENSDEDIQVTFYLTDAHEMNWVTEFVDAPLFAQTEKQKLFGLIHSGHDARGEKVGRFRVDFHRWEPRHAQILVFSFTQL